MKRRPARVLFVNLTRRCNVDCPRCYLTPFHRASRDAFPDGLLTEILSHPFYRDYKGPVVVIHQGGEPQLLGHKRFRELTQEVSRAAPHARQTVVTNLFNAPLWFRELAHDTFQGRIETTWAAGRKQTLAGDEDRFQAAFRSALKDCVEHKLVCPINVELNDATAEMGPDYLIDMMLETGARDVEFDLSIDFAKFRRNPRFAMGHAPLLPPTIPYTRVTQYLLDFRRRLVMRGLEGRIRSHSLMPLSQRDGDLPFNTRCEDLFFTINPDGTITTIPLYSDIEETYLGNVLDDGMDACVLNPERMARMSYEVIRCAPCQGCEHEPICRGGPSHAPQSDGSGECAGLKGVLDKLSGVVVR